MTDIISNYSEYAFLSDNEQVEDAQSKMKCEDMTKMVQLIGRSYETPMNWYYVVFAPFDDPYNRDPDWFKVKGMDYCRLFFKKPMVSILTRETEANKVHINALVCTDQKYHSGQNYRNKYRLNVSVLATQGDRQRILTYITKESKKRPFTRYLDYYSYGRK